MSLDAKALGGPKAGERNASRMQLFIMGFSPYFLTGTQNSLYTFSAESDQKDNVAAAAKVFPEGIIREEKKELLT
jgi:hypothetical protein